MVRINELLREFEQTDGPLVPAAPAPQAGVESQETIDGVKGVLMFGAAMFIGLWLLALLV